MVYVEVLTIAGRVVFSVVCLWVVCICLKGSVVVVIVVVVTAIIVISIIIIIIILVLHCSVVSLLQ